MPPSSLKTERRNKSRKRPPSLVYVELPSGNGGMMRDLSEEGFAVRAMMPLRAGENISFSFSLDESIRIEGEGEILWIEENGRVAGVRFTQVSSTARTQIQNWLSAPEDSLKRNEIPRESVAPAAPTLDQLREEIRSVVVEEKPLEAIQAVPPPPAPETVPIAPEVIASAPAPENALSDLQPSALGETPVAPITETPPDLASAPVLPPLPQMPAEIDHSAEWFAPRPASVHDPFPQAELPRLILPSAIAESDAEPSQADPALPDISEILIQPSGRQASYSPNSFRHWPLPDVDQVPEAPRTSWTDRFTLSRAVAIMILITLVVAFSAFHRAVGQGLIWLGQQMGGTVSNQSPLPASNAADSTGSPAESSSNLGASPSQETTSGEPAANNRQNAAGAPAPGNNPQASLSTVAKNVLPPVSPLSGISAPSSSNRDQEPGQTEFEQAAQLLRGKDAGADTSEAVRLLWISVEKGNSSAELQLADLYWHGQGVVKNCDQTRLLLSAAARKGSAVAQKRLQQFEREGCE